MASTDDAATSGSPGPARTIRYLESYAYVFDNPNWVRNLLLVAIIQLIPIAGPIVLIGYLTEVFIAMHEDAQRTHPDFQLDRFTDYLKQGVWPFLVVVVASLVWAPFVLIIMYGGMGAMLGIIWATSEELAGVVLGVGIPLQMLVMLIASTAFYALLIPMSLNSMLQQSFKAGFDWAFIRDFLGRVSGPSVMCVIFAIVSSLILAIVGLLLCIVGTYAANALFAYSALHLGLQLYTLYLARGGKPIPIKPIES